MERRIAFEGCFNFRDLGGYRTQEGDELRWRRLFRSDTLNFMTEADLQRARNELQISTVIDLRTEALAEANPSELSAAPAIYHNVSLQSTDEEGEYVHQSSQPDAALSYLLATAAPRLAEIFHVLANEDAYPAVFHCRMGKDRSGVIAALVLSALGVSDADIADDWALSERYLKDWVAHRRSLGYGQQVDRTPKGFFDTPRAPMLALLGALQSGHGSAGGFLEAHGVTRRDLDGLRTAMLGEPS